MIEPTDELNVRLLSLIDWIGQTGKELESGIREQAPELAREMIAWAFWSSAIGAAVLVIAGSVSARIAWWGFKNSRRLVENENPGGIFAMAFGTIGALAFLSCAVCNSLEAVKVKVAPRVYLVEQASHWIKK